MHFSPFFFFVSLICFLIFIILFITQVAAIISVTPAVNPAAHTTEPFQYQLSSTIEDIEGKAAETLRKLTEELAGAPPPAHQAAAPRSPTPPPAHRVRSSTLADTTRSTSGRNTVAFSSTSREPASHSTSSAAVLRGFYSKVTHSSPSMLAIDIRGSLQDPSEAHASPSCSITSLQWGVSLSLHVVTLYLYPGAQPSYSSSSCCRIPATVCASEVQFQEGLRTGTVEATGGESTRWVQGRCQHVSHELCRDPKPPSTCHHTVRLSRIEDQRRLRANDVPFCARPQGHHSQTCEWYIHECGVSGDQCQRTQFVKQGGAVREKKVFIENPENPDVHPWTSLKCNM